MLVLSLDWPGRQYPITLDLPGISLEDFQSEQMSRHLFPIGARRPAPTNDHWRSRWLRCLVGTALALVCFAPPSDGQARKQILIITELGLSHPGIAVVTNQIDSALTFDQSFQEEIYTENLDAADLSEDELNERRDSLVHKYGNTKLDLMVLVGPDPIRVFGKPSKTIFPDVPIVFCCTVPGQVAGRNVDSRSTGSWFQLDPAKTLDAALNLLPETRQVFVVGGQSKYDRGVTALTKAGLNSYESRLDIAYLTGLAMNELQERLRHLPSHSIVLYLSFFMDAQGRSFLNATEALPMVTAASSAPVFGISDSYLGHGIVGGFVASFNEQGKIASRDVLAILGGKSPQDIPVVLGPSVYLFDWRELQRWNLGQSNLPPGSTVLFRQPTFWEQYSRPLVTGSLIFVSLSVLAIYLLFEQKQLKRARKTQEQLSGLLINAQEKERSRLAAEIHDDFSQRLALLALGLENAEETIGTSPNEAVKQVHSLLNSASEIGADLHTLSHRLHSSTLEALGLVPGVSALCKEFTNQQGIEIDFLPEDIPRAVHPNVALCLFRIVQEGLRNLKRHSGASKAQVRLRRVGDKLVVSVCDKGVGFDVRHLGDKEGLGIRSMEERAYLLGGRFEVHSAPGKGTRIEAWVPLRPKSELAAG